MNILWQAKNALNRLGWHKGAFESGTGAVCALGAINTVISGGNSYSWSKSFDGDPYAADGEGYSEEYHKWIAENDKLGQVYTRVVMLLTDTINELYPRGLQYGLKQGGQWSGVAAFNDAPNVTQDMVMHAFAHAAAQLDAEENDEQA